MENSVRKPLKIFTAVCILLVSVAFTQLGQAKPFTPHHFVDHRNQPLTHFDPLWHQLNEFYDTSVPEIIRMFVITSGPSATFITYIIDTYGEEKLREFLENIGKPPHSLDSAALATFGLPKQSLENKWLDYIAEF